MNQPTPNTGKHSTTGAIFSLQIIQTALQQPVSCSSLAIAIALTKGLLKHLESIADALRAEAIKQQGGRK